MGLKARLKALDRKLGVQKTVRDAARKAAKGTAFEGVVNAAAKAAVNNPASIGATFKAAARDAIPIVATIYSGGATALGSKFLAGAKDGALKNLNLAAGGSSSAPSSSSSPRGKKVPEKRRAKYLR